MLRIQQDSERLSKRRQRKIFKSDKDSDGGKVSQDEKSIAEQMMTQGGVDESFGYLDAEENIPAWISNMFKDPFDVSMDADDNAFQNQPKTTGERSQLIALPHFTAAQANINHSARQQHAVEDSIKQMKQIQGHQSFGPNYQETLPVPSQKKSHAQSISPSVGAEQVIVELSQSNVESWHIPVAKPTQGHPENNINENNRNDNQ